MYSFNNQYPVFVLPDRIRLSNGRTRTDRSTFTAEEILDAGWIEVSDPPVAAASEVVEWDGSGWYVRQKTAEELEQYRQLQWNSIRADRNERIAAVEWRVNRCLSQQRMGLPTIDDISKLDKYIQDLRDITTQTDPDNIIWPVLE